MNQEELNKEYNKYGNKCYYDEIMRDLNAEPKIFCEIEKRRKCDSYYIKLYNELKKMYEKEVKRNLELKETIETYKQLLSVYQTVSEEIVFEVTGKVVK